MIAIESARAPVPGSPKKVKQGRLDKIAAFAAQMPERAPLIRCECGVKILDTPAERERHERTPGVHVLSTARAA